ncbi:MAG: hypothetical protein MUC87_15900 [Bacteroidia bacterium]|jgi:hypothetical protein|nr:hypothetical protein [Bacteroidia bacterium]
MKQILLIILSLPGSSLGAQTLTRSSVAQAGAQLEDVMEITDTTHLRSRLAQARQTATNTPGFLLQLRLGILYHEAALNFTLLAKTGDKGLAAKSYTLLDSLAAKTDTANSFMPFIASYRASALALMAGETGNLKQLGSAFSLFETAVAKYSAICAMPEFLRGSVAENLPAWMYRKHRYARRDFTEIIRKYEADSSYATPSLMSFTYWAWANAHRKTKYRAEAFRCLNRAVALDKQGIAGRPRAEALKKELEDKQ